MGLRTAAIEEPATLDGGDVLQAGHAVRGARRADQRLGQLRALLAPPGRTVIAVPLSNVLQPEVRGDRERLRMRSPSTKGAHCLCSRWY